MIRDLLQDDVKYRIVWIDTNKKIVITDWISDELLKLQMPLGPYAMYQAQTGEIIQSQELLRFFAIRSVESSFDYNGCWQAFADPLRGQQLGVLITKELTDL